MQRISVTIRDINVLFAADLSVSKWFASAIAGRFNSLNGDLDFYSADMVRWYNEDEAIFFNYSSGSRKYAALLLLLHDFPSLSGKKQLQILRTVKKSVGFNDYEALQCMLIVPDKLLERNSNLSEYPVVLSWNSLRNILLQEGGSRGEYLAQKLKCVVDEPISDWMSSGLVLN